VGEQVTNILPTKVLSETNPMPVPEDKALLSRNEEPSSPLKLQVTSRTRSKTPKTLTYTIVPFGAENERQASEPERESLSPESHHTIPDSKPPNLSSQSNKRKESGQDNDEAELQYSFRNLQKASISLSEAESTASQSMTSSENSILMAELKGMKIVSASF
jgi:hypothetical protein